jgi:hypothetical protein
LLPRYRLELVSDAADQLIYEESANYGDAFTSLGIGVCFLAIAIVGVRLDPYDLSRRKLLGTFFTGGIGFCGLSLPYFIKSKVVLSREDQSLIIRRSLLGIPWTRRYPIEEVNRIYEGGTPRSGGKKLLALELANARTKRITLWAKRTSLSAEEAHLNEALKRYRRHIERQTGRVHKPTTDENLWELTKSNASIDLRRHLRRALYTFLGFIVPSAITVPFFAGNSLHAYWGTFGVGTLLLALLLLFAFLLEAVFSYTSWCDLRDIRQIDSDQKDVG